jgi:hypothetical protein
MAAYKSFSQNTRKMSLQPLLNKNSQAHTESKIDVLGVARKLVKYVVHFKKRRKKKTNLFFFSQGAQIYPNSKRPFFGPMEFQGSNVYYFTFTCTLGL